MKKFVYKNSKTGMYLAKSSDETSNIFNSLIHSANLFIFSNTKYERIEFGEELKRNRKEKLIQIYENK